MKWCTYPQIYGLTAPLKIKFNDFQQITRSRSALLPMRDKALYGKIIFELLKKKSPTHKPMRFLGVSIHNLQVTHHADSQ
ncbi:DinB/UmuC family translesion DNA polymerase [Runella aurantiaca]|uniref:DinB/UmuC family translesion DNA polymerase n=1 Tax=Runella aurantiaca TaxID=2282308 RepID=UPI001E5312CA|nr:hypothetical protein [Runella aurantiaca]